MRRTSMLAATIMVAAACAGSPPTAEELAEEACVEMENGAGLEALAARADDAEDAGIEHSLLIGRAQQRCPASLARARGENEPEPAQQTWELAVTEGTCRTEHGFFMFEGEVTNTTDVARSYRINVNLETDDIRVADGFDLVQDVRPGETARWESMGSVTGDVPDGARCQVTEVEELG